MNTLSLTLNITSFIICLIVGLVYHSKFFQNKKHENYFETNKQNIKSQFDIHLNTLMFLFKNSQALKGVSAL